jgi:hypothetical protein
VHLTVGVDTHIWGLNFASLRDSSFKRSGVNDKVLLTKLDDSLYWELQVTMCYTAIVCYSQESYCCYIYILCFIDDLYITAYSKNT